jgi:hypothetical protein
LVKILIDLWLELLGLKQEQWWMSCWSCSESQLEEALLSCWQSSWRHLFLQWCCLD